MKADTYHDDGSGKHRFSSADPQPRYAPKEVAMLYRKQRACVAFRRFKCLKEVQISLSLSLYIYIYVIIVIIVLSMYVCVYIYIYIYIHIFNTIICLTRGANVRGLP